MMAKMYPELYVSDVERMASFFEEALGFRVTDQFEDDGVIDFAVLKSGEIMLYLHNMLPVEESSQSRHTRLFFEPDDIFGLHARLRDKGFTVSDLEDQDYGAGARSCKLAAPDSYEIVLHQFNTN